MNQVLTERRPLQAWWPEARDRGLWALDSAFVRSPLDIGVVRDTSRPLRVGYFSNDGRLPPAPASLRLPSPKSPRVPAHAQASGSPPRRV